MRFDPLAWDEVNPNEEKTCKGNLRVRSSREGALYIQVEGVEALYGVGTSFDVETPLQMTWRLEAPADARVFVLRAFGTSVESEGETFTNIDRMPHESEAVSEVTRALRMLELERRSIIAQLRAEASQVSGRIAAGREASGETVVEPPETEPDEEVSG